MKTDAIKSAILAAETFCQPEGTAIAKCARDELTALEAENENLRTVVPKLPHSVVLVNRETMEGLECDYLRLLKQYARAAFPHRDDVFGNYKRTNETLKVFTALLKDSHAAD